MQANECDVVDGVRKCTTLVGPEYFWIMMEAIAFYSYMGATVAYIFIV